MEEVKENELIENNIEIDGLTEREASEFKTLLTKFVKSYSAKDAAVSDKDWLRGEYKRELDISDEKADDMARETIDAIRAYDENFKDLNESCSAGKPKEQWFADKLTDAASGVSVIEYGNYLDSIDTAVTNANAQMQRTVMTNAGGISQCINLDGYIAEQYHVDGFNIEAAARKSRYYAEVKVPGPGETYGKNSFDVVIKDSMSRSNVPVHQYQVKYGANAKETIKLLMDTEGKCRYNNQTIVVPAEQVEEVRKAFPGKTITDRIGDSDKIGFGSRPLTKAQAKQLQKDTQLENTAPRTDWNSMATKELALNIGKQAAFAGVGAAAITTGFALAEQIVRREGVDVEATVELALKSGTDAGVKAAAAGAMKVGAEKGILKIIPPGTPALVIANIACVTVENAKILGKVATGEYTISQGMENMGRTTVALTYGLSWGAKGATIGASALSWIPVVGPVVGGLAGGIIGHMAGSKFGSTVFNGLKKATGGARKAMSSAWSKIKSGVGRIKRKLFG